MFDKCFPSGNQEFLKLLRAKPFDRESAEIKLLIAYGGGRPKQVFPRILKPIDRTRIDEYQVHIIRNERSFFTKAFLKDTDVEDAVLLYEEL